MALIGYVAFEAPEEERNFITLLELVNACEVREDDESYQSPVDLLFEQLAQEKPNHFASRQYRKIKHSAAKTMKSILITCGSRLAPFDVEEIRRLMAYDEMALDKMGDRKTALFCIVSDTDPTFNFIAAMLYSQLFNTLCDKALSYGGRLPVHVTCLLDEFANQKIPNFERLISVIRSRNISAHILVQTQSQLRAVYKDHAETIIGCCSSILFLGGKEPSTLKSISESLGKETIDTYSESGHARTAAQSWAELSKARQAADDARRAGHHARQPMHSTVARVFIRFIRGSTTSPSIRCIRCWRIRMRGIGLRWGIIKRHSVVCTRSFAHS